MAESEKTCEGEWEGSWECVAALAPILGKPADRVYHAVVPFQLGGSADVLSFSGYTPGATYVTAELPARNQGSCQAAWELRTDDLCSRRAVAGGRSHFPVGSLYL